MNRSDTELIRLARAGENEAFAVLWHRYEPQVMTLCRRYLAGGAVDPVVDPADIATETFIRALHALDRYEDRTATGVGFEAWLLEIAKRLCLKVRERFRRRQQWHGGLPHELWEERPGAIPLVQEMIEERELLQFVAEAINALPHLYRQPFKLFLEEYSHKEIAAQLGIRVETAMQRIHRARRQLQPQLAPFLALAVAERALTEIVHDARIITVALPSGGELQLCLRGESRLVSQEAEIATRRRQLQRHPRAWKPFLEFAQLCYRAGHWKEARDAYQ
ncbi:RNA polymerase sigma factor, partial [Armatimonas sp.]|uniref:RNA polymerase sigma factor n=1 Tax=Armatimonas sp. TaxID=1872638 RepID=UPI0037527FD3